MNQSNNINVDTGFDKRLSNNQGAPASILNAKTQLNSYTSQLTSGIYDEAKQLESQIANIERYFKSVNDLEDKLQSKVRNSAAFKEASDAQAALQSHLEKINKMIKEQNTNFKDLVETYYDGVKALSQAGVALGDVRQRTAELRKDEKAYDKEALQRRARNKQEARDRIKAAEEEKKIVLETQKEANKSFGKSMSDTISKWSSTLQRIQNTFNIDALVNATQRSSRTNTQTELQRAYNLNKSGFGTLKRNISSTVNTSVYSSKDMMSIYEQLLDLGIGNAETATQQFNTILRGQKLLGMSAETQAKLIAAGNRTGTNQLEFQTNQVAKFQRTATNLSQKQLDQMIQMNSTLSESLAAKGIDTPEFMEALNNTTAALDDLTQDGGITSNLYRTALENISANVGNSASLFGLDEGDVRNRLNSGQGLYDLIMSSANSGTGRAGDLYNRLRNNYSDTLNNWSKYTEGMDPATTQFIKKMYDIENKQGKTFSTLLDKYKANGDDTAALVEKESLVEQSTSWLAKRANEFTNWIQKTMDWTDMDMIKSSLSVIIAILSAMEIGNIIKDVGSLFKSGSGLLRGNGGSLLGGSGSGLGGKLFGAGSLLGGKTGLSWTSYGSGALGSLATMAGIGGSVWAGVDAIKGYTDTSYNMYGQNANFGQKLVGGVSGLFSGSTVHKNDQGKVDVGANAGKGALSGAGKGALIGSFFGPLGTLIGAGVGAAGGALFGWLKGSKAKKQEEELEKQTKSLEKIEENTANTAKSTAYAYGSALATRTTTAYMPASGGGIGGGSITTPSGWDPYKKYKTKDNKEKYKGFNFPKRVNGGWPTYWADGSGGPHSGIDFGESVGTKVGAAHPGTVQYVNYDNRNTYNGGKGDHSGGNWIKVKGDDGYTYTYFHLSKNLVKKGDHISRGQLIGLSGNTGYSTGPHLHFAAYKGSKSVDPAPRVTNSLFSPGEAVSDSFGYSEANNTTNTSSIFDSSTLKFSNIGGPNDITTPIVGGLAEIKETLINLADRQSQNESIIRMLAGRERPDPTL